MRSWKLEVGSEKEERLVALTVGARLGTYEILGALGAGGMGEVYRARDTKLWRDVAIEILPPVLRGQSSN